MVYVFDTSFIAALIIPDERAPHSDKMYTRIKNEDEKYTPQLLWYEITNLFKNLIVRKRYTADEISHFFLPLAAIGLKTDFETGTGYSQKIFDLCNNYKLTSYDAAYLELAERKKAVLCTLDRNLKSAAKKHGVKVLNGI